MKKLKTAALITAALIATAPAFANSIAAKTWYAEATDIEDPAWLYGVTGSLNLSEKVWISAMLLTGTYDGTNTRGVPIRDVDTTDAEIVLGFTTTYIDIGIGGRYSVWSWEGIDDDFQMFGPMVYAGIGDSIAESPVGWYLGGSYMFKDFGDADEDGLNATYEHYNVEGGISLSFDPLTATIGYRYKSYIDSDIDLDFKGFVGSVGFGF